MAGGINPFGFAVGGSLPSAPPRQPQDIPAAPFGFAPPPSKWEQTAAILNEYNPIDAFWRLYDSDMAKGGAITDQNIEDGMMVGGTVMGGGAMIPKPANALNMGIRAFHGSPHSFDKFSMDKARTAKHIYTTPIEADAKHYGPNTYEVEINGRIGDFRPDARGQDEYRALKAAYEDQGLSDYFEDFDDFVSAFDAGEMYQRFASQRPQNYTMDGLFDQGFDAVRIPDAGFGGQSSESIVVRNPYIISIVRKYGIAGASAMLGYNLLDGLSEAQAAELQKYERGQ